MMEGDFSNLLIKEKQRTDISANAGHPRPMRVAVVHEWLISYAGSERVVRELLTLFPQADLFSVVDFLSPEDRTNIFNKKAKTSFVQKLPFAKKKYRSYLPLMPMAIEQFDFSEYDLVISSSHAVAKGILTGPDQTHICYCHTPIRYAWDFQHRYLRDSGLSHGLKSILARLVLHYIRLWDVRTASGVDHFIANSKYIGRRIEKVYGRKSTVIHPPVDIENFSIKQQKEDFYVTASRMVPYKRIDLIVEAFAKMRDRRLIVIGDGPDMKKIRSLATDNITFLGYQSNDVLRDHLQRARAFVFAAEEDFGILPVEAQACGTPVIAYGKGGALETVIDLENAGALDPTGLLFYEQTADAVVAAVESFEKHEFKPSACRIWAEGFSSAVFQQSFMAFLDQYKIVK